MKWSRAIPPTALAMVTAWVMSADASHAQNPLGPPTHTPPPPAPKQPLIPSPVPAPEDPLRKPAKAPASGEESFDSIVDPALSAKVIAEGLEFTEGPVWIPGHDNLPGYLLFSDIPADTIYKLDVSKITAQPDDTRRSESEKAKPEVFLKPSGFSNGLTLDQKGRLVIAQHVGKVVRRELNDKPDAPSTVLAEKYEGKTFNSPNDLIVAPDGSIYFTDPPYGVRPPLGPEGRTRELDFTGIYRLSPAGGLTLLNKSFASANGLAFSPDFKTLYVTETGNGNIQAFPVNADGTLGDPRLFACNDAGSTGAGGRGSKRGADGVRVDVQGHVYAVGPGGVWVYSTAGKLLGKIATPTSPTNLCFGGPDNKTLFMTTRDSVCMINVKIAGMTVPKPAPGRE